MSADSKLVVGCEEWCQLGGLGLPAVKARVDSGARTSALHAFNIQPFVNKGDQWVSFEVHPIQDNRRIVVRCECPIVDRRTIKSSSGETEKRYVVSAPLTMLNGSTWDIELTLTNRDSMGYRMLLGREAMAERMMVDPGAHFLLGDQSEDEVLAQYRNDNRKRSGLKIGLIASNPKLYSNQRIMEAGEERGHEMSFLNIKQCYMKLDEQTPEVHYRGGWVLNDLNAVIPRIRPSMTFYGCALVRHFESMGVPALNTASSITSSRDKLFSLQLLLQQEIAIPITGFANSPLDTKDLIEMVGGAPLIVKLLEGAQGSGVVLAETDKAAESVINAFKTIHANILVQEFIKESSGTDIRCFVVGGKVVASIMRSAASGDFRANIHQGGSAKGVKITAEERKMAVKAAKVLGLSVAGVDIIRSKRGPLLLEVNSSPGLQGIESVTGKDIAGHMIAAVEKAAGWNRELGTDVYEADGLDAVPSVVTR